MSWEILYPAVVEIPGSSSPHNPMAKSSRFVSLRAFGPGLLAISTKGQREPSGLIKTGQLTRPCSKTCIIYSGSSPSDEIGNERAAARM